MEICKNDLFDMAVYEGERTKEGDLVGTFRIESSTYCLHLSMETCIETNPLGEAPAIDAKSMPISAQTATAVRQS